MKVAIYARVSSERQDTDLSITAQLKSLREYANKNKHHIVKEFIDEAESGRTAARPAFKEMIAMARRSSRPFEAVLVWKYSRFARSREDSVLFKTMLRKHGVHVVSISEPSDDTPTGRLMEAMIESLDEFYSANLGQEVRRGMRESASRGFYMGGRVPYGYQRVKVKDGSRERPKLQIHPQQSPVVARIFREFLSGKGLKDISRSLNTDGISSPRGKRWGKTTVHGILVNETYTGTLIWGRHSQGFQSLPPIRIDNAWEAIVDNQTYGRAQALLKERAPANLHPRRVASRYLLSGLARCGYCGKALICHEAKSGQFNYYICGTLLKQGAGACEAHYLNKEKFERVIIEKIKERILTEDNLRDLVRLVNDEMDATTSEKRQQLDTVVAELTDVHRRLDSLNEALETKMLSIEDLAPRIQALRHREDQLQAAKLDLEKAFTERKIALADADLVQKYAEDLRELLNSSPLVERRTFIRSFVKDIEVTGNEVLLKYKIPLLPDGGSHEAIGVLDTVHYGGPFWTRTRDLSLIRTAL